MSSFYARYLTQSYPVRIQESPTLDLANDCFRFVTGYLDIISASSQHIYHSALVVAPEDSMVRRLYKSHAHPFARVVHGLPMSWGTNTAATARPSSVNVVVWSSCNRFIAITWDGSRAVDVLDSATLQRLQTLELPQDILVESQELMFSPDSHVLMCCSSTRTSSSDLELFVVSWDLQTGGEIGVIKWQGGRRSGFTPYSEDGKMVGFCDARGDQEFFFFVYDVASGVLMDSHSFEATIPLDQAHTWIHGESLQFVTANATAITIWEVIFTSGATPTQIETLPAPGRFDDEWRMAAFLPDLCRVALSHKYHGILVWDARDSRYLLEDTDIDPEKISFSSDGRFLACATQGPDVYLWKDSPDGYLLHGILTSGVVGWPDLRFAQSGELIVTFGGCVIQLWNTNRITTTPSSTLTQAHTGNLILEFSPDGMLAAVAMPGGNTVMVLNLEASLPRLTVDAGMVVCGLGMTGNAVVVIGEGKVIAWNLPAGDCVPDAPVGLGARSWTVNFWDSRSSQSYYHSCVSGASISPDSRYIALVHLHTLHIHRTSTGERVGKKVVDRCAPRFSPDGCKIWGAGVGDNQAVYGFCGGHEEVQEWPKNEVYKEHPPQESPWGTPLGYQVTDDWWILGPGGKRLLMLPPPWRSYAVHRMWEGQFLALVHAGLSEPVILHYFATSPLGDRQR